MTNHFGCKYCRTEPNGDFGRDLEPLMEVLDWTNTDMVDHGLEMESEELPDYTRSTHVAVFGDKLTLTTIQGNYSVRINYCPVCGRDLEGEEKYEREED